MTVLKDIHKHYGRVRPNHGISLALEPGHIHGLVGKNGAGGAEQIFFTGLHVSGSHLQEIFPSIPAPVFHVAPAAIGQDVDPGKGL